ncbi:MAG: NfeD family protein [Polyangiaceae bacterium]|nr:NfeD family protein [Polyangiaceae bacterium]
MGLVYLFAFVVGLGILGLQAAMGGKGGGDDVGGQGDAAGKPLAVDDAIGKGVGGSFDFVAFFLSLRFWIFASLGFGMSGSLLHFLALATPLVVFALAVASGLGAGLFASLAFRYVMRSSVSTTADVTQATGTVGRVLVPVGKQKTGQIRVVLQGQSVDLIAKTDGEDIARGEQVIVEEIDGNTARVSKSPTELL